MAQQTLHMQLHETSHVQAEAYSYAQPYAQQKTLEVCALPLFIVDTVRQAPEQIAFMSDDRVREQLLKSMIQACFEESDLVGAFLSNLLSLTRSLAEHNYSESCSCGRCADQG